MLSRVKPKNTCYFEQKTDKDIIRTPVAFGAVLLRPRHGILSATHNCWLCDRVPCRSENDGSGAECS